MSEPVDAAIDPATLEQRISGDRRRFGWRTVYWGFLRSRRHGVRRSGDGDVVFMDRHHPWLFFLAVGTMMLSVADAFFTLQLLDRGMIEANPVMAALLGKGTATFAAAKMLMTAFGVLTLVYLAKTHFLDRLRTGIFLTVFFSAYACLVCYEIVNLLRLS